MDSSPHIEQYLRHYIDLVKWDLDKMVRIAEEVESKNARYSPTATMPQPPVQAAPVNFLGTVQQPPYETIPTSSFAPVASPVPVTAGVAHFSIGATTGQFPPLDIVYIPTDFMKYHRPEDAKCAVPMAMTLFSSIEFLGTLLWELRPGVNRWDQNSKFKNAAISFFKMAGAQLHSSQFELMNVVFRNGLVHLFLPTAKNVGIDYSTHKANALLFYEGPSGQVVLNVKKLMDIVQEGFKIIVTAKNLFPKISEALIGYNDKISETENALIKYKSQLSNGKIKI